jgi:hypothetical protein
MRCVDADPAKLRRPPEQQRRRGHALSPRRVAAVVAFALLAFGLRRHLRFAREVFRHRRRLKLAFTLLVFLRQLRKS